MGFELSKVVIWLFLLKIAAIAVQVHAQSPQGFISIDCGIASNSSYVDQETGITYVSDDQYIDTGSISSIDPVYKTSSLPSQLSNLRSFPTGDRNCYTLPVVQFQRYLVRARFVYGNYDGKNSNDVNPIQFDLHLGTNFWKTINITDASSSQDPEALTTTEANFLFVCLINTGKGVPFVSALELRPLKDTMYNFSRSDLALVRRDDMGALTDRMVRYPKDPYDRFWRPYNKDSWVTISTNQSVGSQDDSFESPSDVLRTASQPAKGMTMDFEFGSDSPAVQLYTVLCFAEVQVLAGNSTRLFDIYNNNDLFYGNNSLDYLSATYIYSTQPFSGSTSYKYSLVATNDSTLPPLINALEMYSVMTAVGVPTDLEDGSVSAMKAIKEQYQVKRNWMGDPCTPRQYSWNGVNCAYSRNSSRIISLNLSSSGLSGVISYSFVKLTALTYLDLSNNSLTGTIPDTLGNIPSLQVLILSCNNLTGPIPASLLRKSDEGKIILRFDNDTNACQNSITLNPSSSSKSKISKPIIVVVSVVPAVILLAMVYMIWRVRRLGAWGSNPFVPLRLGDRIKLKRDHVDHTIHVEVKQFSYKQLANITRNFERAVGKGGFGTVFSGNLQGGGEVAVKMLSQTSKQGTKQFLAEAQNLARIHHRNLVSLIGYCMDGDHLGLVYEYMPQGSLREHIRGNAGYRTLRWAERLRIAVEAAQGLEYLHKGCSPPIIHRDVKTSNILLNKDLEAKLADFGLSKAFHDDRETHVSTMGVVGTLGYVDPEYQNSLVLNEKSDVYSFGVVLMELITGQPPIMPDLENVHIAQRVAQSIERGYIDDIVDERIRGEYDVNSIWKIVDLSLKCTASTRGQRPSMSEVVMQLKETMELQKVGSSETGQSLNAVTYTNPSPR